MLDVMRLCYGTLKQQLYHKHPDWRQYRKVSIFTLTGPGIEPKTFDLHETKCQ